jgi:hypothetical protein
VGLSDYRIYEYIIEHSEFVPRFEAFYDREAELDGFVPGTHANRVPFQSLLIDVVGEMTSSMIYTITPGW